MIMSGQIIHQQAGSRASSSAPASVRALDSAQSTDNFVGTSTQIDSASNDQDVVTLRPTNSVTSPNRNQADSTYYENTSTSGVNSNNTYQNPKIQSDVAKSGIERTQISSHDGNNVSVQGGGLSSETAFSPKEIEIIQSLKRRDQEVRQHEAAHASVGGALAGAPTYTFAKGPDGQRYAVGGEVNIDTSEGRTPEETLRKAQVIRAAANAPQEPSAQDRQVALKAVQMSFKAKSELAGLEAEGKVVSGQENERVGKVELEENETVGSVENAATGKADDKPGSVLSQEQKKDKDEAELAQQEKEEFVLPMFDKEHRSAADIFKEIYGQEDELAQKLIDLGVNQDELSPLAVAIDLTA